MLTLTELQGLKLNAPVAREAYTQTEKRLMDALETRKSFEQKATSLFGAYVTISLAMFGIAAAIYRDPDTGAKVWPFFAAAMALAIGAGFFVCALKDAPYGAVGSSPDMWLTHGVIDGDDPALASMLAYVTFHHNERIAISRASNARKARRIRWGIYLGAVAPFAFIIVFLVA